MATALDKRVEFLVKRLDSHSKRIRKINHHVSNIENYRKSYERHRLSGVIKREKVKYGFSVAVSKAIKLLGVVRKNFSLDSTSKNNNLKHRRHLGLFTNSEMRRLRQFLATNHKNEYFLYRYKNYAKCKGKSMLFLTTNEKQKLRWNLNKKSAKKKIKSPILLSNGEKQQLKRLLKKIKYQKGV